MVKFILGPSGSGKTKWLIDEANKDKKLGTGNIVFIDTDDSHIFSLDHSVRLINAADYHINSYEEMYGFLCGIISGDYDIEKIYIDGIYDIIPYNESSFLKISEDLDRISKEFHVDFFAGMNKTKEELPEPLRDMVLEIQFS